VQPLVSTRLSSLLVASLPQFGQAVWAEAGSMASTDNAAVKTRRAIFMVPSVIADSRRSLAYAYL
jgi:hypothetical protein